MPSQKGFSPILLIASVIIVVSLIAGAFLLGKSTMNKPAMEDVGDEYYPSAVPSVLEPPHIEDPGEWQTYTDEEAKFSFPHPKDFKVATASAEPDKRVLKVIYDNPNAPGLAPYIAPKEVMEISIIKSAELADVYANQVVAEISKNSDFMLQDPGVTQESINSKPDYKLFVRIKNYNEDAIRYDFFNHGENLIQLKTYYPNSPVNFGPVNSADYMIYRMKLN